MTIIHEENPVDSPDREQESVSHADEKKNNAAALQRQRLTQRIEELFGVRPDFPFPRDSTSAVFRHPHSGKWFALMMRIPQSRLGLRGDAPAEILNVKCDPLLTGSLRREPGFFPAYHMNKETWITIRLNDTVQDSGILSLLNDSYDSVAPRTRTKKRKPRSPASAPLYSVPSNAI